MEDHPNTADEIPDLVAPTSSSSTNTSADVDGTPFLYARLKSDNRKQYANLMIMYSPIQSPDIDYGQIVGEYRGPAIDYGQFVGKVLDLVDTK